MYEEFPVDNFSLKIVSTCNVWRSLLCKTIAIVRSLQVHYAFTLVRCCIYGMESVSNLLMIYRSWLLEVETVVFCVRFHDIRQWNRLTFVKLIRWWLM